MLTQNGICRTHNLLYDKEQLTLSFSVCFTTPSLGVVMSKLDNGKSVLDFCKALLRFEKVRI